MLIGIFNGWMCLWCLKEWDANLKAEKKQVAQGWAALFWFYLFLLSLEAFVF